MGMKISNLTDPECCRSICPVANALDILGDRWTLLVIRDLMLRGKHEFREFLEGPEGVATNILSDRLKRLLCTGVINQTPHPTHKNKKMYYLTQKGKDLLPVVVELARWGGAYHASPDMPKALFQKLKRDPKKFMKNALKQTEAWEEKNLKRRRSLHD